MSKESSLTKEKKKGRLLLVICFIVVMILCGGLGYFLGTSDLINPKNVKEESTKKEEKKSNKKCPEQIAAYDEVAIGNVNKIISNIMLKCDNEEFFFNDKKVTVDDIDQLRAYSTVMKAYTKSTDEIPASQIKEDAKKLFGKDFDLKPSAELCNKICSNYYYDAESDSFKYREPACGGACGPDGADYAVSKAVIDGDNLIIDLKVVFIDSDERYNPIYYSDFAHTKPVENAYEQLDRMLQGSNYRFTLKNEDGNYVFVSSEPIK